MNKLHRQLNNCFRKLEGRFRSLLFIFFITSIYFVLLYKRQNPEMTPLMVIRFVDQVIDNRPIVLKYTRVPIQAISDYSMYAVMAGEDQKFLDHYGFDFDAIRNAVEYNVKHKTITLGGSTITQQTAKNLFLWPDRSLFRKVIESYFTILMELGRSKERILEIYLNIVEFGDGIYGIDQAAHYYFDTSAAKLTRYQATLLAAILPNPRYYQYHLRSYVLATRKSSISSGINRLKRNEESKDFVNEIKK
ncbi:MAG: monofunctional biosynthetic peptidoglycan transglycosylase [Candidatus Absconditabacterales bacterium]